MWAQNVWLPTSNYEKVFTPQYLPGRVKFNWWLIVPTTVIFYWYIVLKAFFTLYYYEKQNKYYVNESADLNKRKYYTIEPAYYNFMMRFFMGRKLRKEHEKATYIL